MGLSVVEQCWCVACGEGEEVFVQEGRRGGRNEKYWRRF